jgi:uncharacterized membrane protein
MAPHDNRAFSANWETSVIDDVVHSTFDTALTAPTRVAPRLLGIDRMRGLVIVIMALDHVRDFFNAEALRFSPTDLSQTYAALFFTRFITHYCAPTFVFLAGASAFLHGTKIGSRKALSTFLFTRGVWLILIEVVAISPVWGFGFGKIFLATLWAIGFSMIILAGLAWLPTHAVLAIGALILLGHNLLDGFHAAQFGDWASLWALLHEPGPLPWGAPGRLVYPVLPWIGVMAVGYGLGPVFLKPAAERERLLTLWGASSIALFVLLRATNFYGDPSPWAVQRDHVTTALSMLNLTKYPPSLLYALVTLGPVFLLLPVMERLRGRVGEILATFGEVPLFFYVLHLYVAPAAAVALTLSEGFTLEQSHGLGAGAVPPEGLGLSLAGTYLVWILLLLALYPACRWFAGVKQRRRDWWLSYL